MKTLIKNANILLNADSDIIYGDILINNNIIEKITENIVDDSVEKVINADKNLIMAGFINCHTHSPMTILKGLGEGESLESWLYNYMFKYEAKLTEEDIYYGTKLSILEYIKNGITTVNDMYYMRENSAKAFYESGLRAYVQCDELSYEETEKEYLKIKKYYPLVKANFGCHSVYTADENRFSKTIKLAKKYGEIVSSHMSETLTEVGNCDKENGLTPTKLLESYGFFDTKALVYHAVHLDKEDFDILKKYNVSVCSNPSSNLKLGSGIAPINALINKGINVCLGTDGSASNNRLDMFREMYLVGCLQKGVMHNSEVITCEEVIKMATENGAKALNISNIGSIKVGNLADLIMIDLHGIDNATNINIKSNLVYASGTEDVLMTMVDGKVLYQNGKFLNGFNETIIYQKVNEIIDRLKIVRT